MGGIYPWKGSGIPQAGLRQTVKRLLCSYAVICNALIFSNLWKYFPSKRRKCLSNQLIIKRF